MDYLADNDLDAPTGAGLAAAYDLVVFPGHTEYVTRREYDVVKGYRDLGGNLVFLSANNFFWRVERRNWTLRKVAKWRDLGRPEAALIGVQYLANDEGGVKAPYTRRLRGDRAVALGRHRPRRRLAVRRRPRRLRDRDRRPARRSPRGTIVLADMPEPLRAGLHGRDDLLRDPAGAKVFAAGTLDFGGRARYKPVKRMLNNLWDRLSQP